MQIPRNPSKILSVISECKHIRSISIFYVCLSSLKKLAATDSYMQSAGFTETRSHLPLKNLAKPTKLRYIDECPHFVYSMLGCVIFASECNSFLFSLISSHYSIQVSNHLLQLFYQLFLLVQILLLSPNFYQLMLLFLLLKFPNCL